MGSSRRVLEYGVTDVGHVLLNRCYSKGVSGQLTSLGPSVGLAASFEFRTILSTWGNFARQRRLLITGLQTVDLLGIEPNYPEC